MNVIRECCDYYGMEKPSCQYFDSMYVARSTWPCFDCHRLMYLGEQFKIEYNAHDTLDDSRTCGKVIALAAEKWGAHSVSELLKKCACSLSSV